MIKFPAPPTFVASLSSAPANVIKPRSAQRVVLGTMEGTAYFSEEPDGFRVVATLVEGEHGKPVRVIATLTEGQSIQLSVPQGVDGPELTFELVRDGSTLILRGPLQPQTASIH